MREAVRDSTAGNEPVLYIDNELNVLSMTDSAAGLFGVSTGNQQDNLSDILSDDLVSLLRKSLQERTPQIFDFTYADQQGTRYQLMCWFTPSTDTARHVLHFHVTTVDHLANTYHLTAMNERSGVDELTMFSEQIQKQAERERKLGEDQGRERNSGEEELSGVAFLDADLNILHVDNVAASFARMPRRKVVGHNVKDLMASRMFPLLDERLKKAKRGEAGSYDLDVALKNGEVLRLHVEAQPVMSQGTLHGIGLVLSADKSAVEKREDVKERIPPAMTSHHGTIDIDRHGQIIDYDYVGESLLSSVEGQRRNVKELLSPAFIRTVLRDYIRHGKQYHKPIFIEGDASNRQYLFRIFEIKNREGRVSRYRILVFDAAEFQDSLLGINTWLDEDILNSMEFPICVLDRNLIVEFCNRFASENHAYDFNAPVRGAVKDKNILGLKSALHTLFARNSKKAMIYRSDFDSEFDYKLIPYRYIDGYCRSAVVVGIRKKKQSRGEQEQIAGRTHQRQRLKREDIQTMGEVRLMCDSMLLRKHLSRLLADTGIPTAREYVNLGDTRFLEDGRPGQINIYAIPFLDSDHIQELKEYVERFPNQRFLVICLSGEQDTEASIISTGVRGVITDEKELPLLPMALRSVSRGELWCSRSVLSSLLSANGGKGTAASKEQVDEERLTRREQEVLREIGKQKTNKEIAATLGVSYTTIVSHVYNIYKKMEFKNRYEAMEFVRMKGW